VQFGSWTYDGTKVNLILNTEISSTGFDLSEYMVNGEWLLMGEKTARTSA
jgi:hypothetical protein